MKKAMIASLLLVVTASFAQQAPSATHAATKAKKKTSKPAAASSQHSPAVGTWKLDTAQSQMGPATPKSATLVVIETPTMPPHGA